MKVLSVETSTLLGGAAVMDENGLIAERRLNVKTTHSERLMKGIEDMVRDSLIELSDIDVLSVSIGPGSFTGLRIGLSAVKGIAFVTGKPVVAVPSLEAFAWNFPFSALPVCIMLDARKKEVYSALFRWREGNFERLMTEASVKPEGLLREIEAKTGGGKILFAGEGALLYGKEITGRLGERALFAAPQHMAPSASNVAYLGLLKARRGEFSDPSSLCPLYVRKSEAELKFG